MAYRLSTFGFEKRRGFYVIEWRYGKAAAGEASTVERIKFFTDQPARDAYMTQRGYI